MAAIDEQVVLGQVEGENAEEKIELILRRCNGDSSLQVRSLRWAQGIGWFVQKTITLDATQAKHFGRLLCQAPVDQQRETRSKAKIIDFPLWRNRRTEILS